jgi:transcriptional regulator with XRE-family HTH domain
VTCNAHAGAALRRLREERGESLRTLAKAVGMDPSYLGRMERGQCSTSDARKLAIAQHFGVPVTAIFFSEAEPAHA